MSRTCAVLLVISLLGSAASDGSGQGFIAGHREYPQFRNAAGLPGSMNGIGPGGYEKFGGAMGISTPVGYSFRRGERYFGLSNLSDGKNLEHGGLSGQGVRGSNATGYIIGGITLVKWGRMSLGGMLLSTKGDTAVNFTWQPPLRNEKLGISIGVQDATNSGGSAGEGLPTDGDISRSYYAVATYPVTPDLYVSVGKGDRRFEGVFGNISQNLGRRVKLVAEYDTFAWNAMVAFDLGQVGSIVPPNPCRISMCLGVIRGKNAFWTLSTSF